MALREYRLKRTFGTTPEPAPSRSPAAAAGRHFVVQKHQASHLHYDLRLEHAGVLKSWAVPKGPSMSPRDKRLAVQVEDHPLAYKDFKGRIPEGQYGAGLVEIWDKGTYSLCAETGRDQPARSMEESLAKGHIDFTLEGKKLKGPFTLVRLKNRDKQWLLIKRKGPPAAAADLTSSGISRKLSFEDEDLKGAVKRPFPTDVSPMLATLVDGPFDRENWSFEVKWDGFRSGAAGPSWRSCCRCRDPFG
jgi:bifunctional non-homologous end joining protein LigD